jgi:hypothetical protein
MFSLFKSFPKKPWDVKGVFGGHHVVCDQEFSFIKDCWTLFASIDWIFDCAWRWISEGKRLLLNKFLMHWWAKPWLNACYPHAHMIFGCQNEPMVFLQLLLISSWTTKSQTHHYWVVWDQWY